MILLFLILLIVASFVLDALTMAGDNRVYYMRLALVAGAVFLLIWKLIGR